ncbi:MAG: transposase [Nostocaceae cyanobacterium]|nr:transposase [Nostocaceae cyanobacterium]
MKAYSTDFRSKIVQAYEQGNTSIRKVAQRFDVSKSFVQKLLKMKKTTGNLEPKQQGGKMKSELSEAEIHLAEMVKKYPDATLSEYCEYWGQTSGQWVSTSTMCRALNRQNLTLKKRLYVAAKQQQKESRDYDASIGRKSKK